MKYLKPQFNKILEKSHTTNTNNNSNNIIHTKNRMNKHQN